MSKLILTNNNLEISITGGILVRAMDIRYKGKFHAESMLPDDWFFFARKNKMLCINLGNSNPSQIMKFEGKIHIYGTSIYDSENNQYSINVEEPVEDKWEIYNNKFDSSVDQYSNLSSTRTKRTNIRDVQIVKNNLETKSEEFYYKDGAPYEGPYHMHMDGTTMTGAYHEKDSIPIYRKNRQGHIVDLNKYKQTYKHIDRSKNKEVLRKLREETGDATIVRGMRPGSEIGGEQGGGGATGGYGD